MDLISKPCAPRLALSCLAALALGTVIQPAQAIVDPPAGVVEFALYSDHQCQGQVVTGSLPGGGTIEEAFLGNLGFNDVASSWSVCNYHPSPVVVTVDLYTDANYSGSHLLVANNVTIPAWTCIAQNHITPNDAVSSVRVHVTM